MRIRATLVLAAALAALAAIPAPADLGAYEIKQFHTELDVQRDGELVVTETIGVDFSMPRHGIYRTIPVRYTDPRGYMYSLGFRLIDVTGPSGRSYGTKVTNEGHYVKIRIGNPSRTVQGFHRYVIRYRVRRALAQFAEYDELYWNATGNEWRTPIPQASAVVRLPAPIETGQLDAAGYTGGMGSREQAVEITFPSPGTVRYEAARPLGPDEGLTVVAGWPRGVVEFPNRLERTAVFLADNWTVAAPFLALAFLVRAYRRRGRDPGGSATVMVRYEPPEGITAAEIGALIDERVDLRDITACVVDLAVRGHLVIEVEEQRKFFGLARDQHVTFKRTKTDDEDLLRYEKLVLHALFASGGQVDVDDLKNEFHKEIKDIQEALYAQLVHRGLFKASPRQVRRRWVARGALAGLGVIVAGVAWGAWRGVLMPYVLLLPVVSGLLIFGLFAAFAPAMPRRTKNGVEIRDWARGFQEFVERVEEDRLEAAEKRNVFETMLPYAMALGLTAAWARKFRGIYEQAGAAPPAWYVGRHDPAGFTTASFERSLSSAMATTGEGMVTAPRAQGGSGFSGGGGGFSGGGVGGGGGGSW